MTTWDYLPPTRLDGQVALITGAGRGIGRAVALALSQAGAAVAACARSADDVFRVAGEIADRGGYALALRCDVTSRDEVAAMVVAVEKTVGPVDLLVNNAAQFGPVGPLAATDPDEWWKALEVNLRGPLYCASAVLPGMLARGHGRIVNVSSGAGFAAIPMLSAYVVSKTALYRLSESLAAETRGHGVTVFAIDPGLVRTAMSQSALSCGEPSIEQWFGDAFANQEDVSAESAAASVVYLASGAADALSGRIIKMSDDVRQMVAQAADIRDRDLYVLREREDAQPHGPAEPVVNHGVDELRYDLERDAVRVVLADASGLVLLFRALTPDEAPDGWWELPGGGIEPGETYLDATIREIREETGLVLDAAQISPPTWRRDSTWRSRGKRRLQHEIVVHAQLAVDQPPVTDGGRTSEETEDYVTARWWRVPEISRSRERFYPGRLPELLPRFLAGEVIDEPFERWN